MYIILNLIIIDIKYIKKIFYIYYIFSSFLCCKLFYYKENEGNILKLKLLLILKRIFVPRINSLPMILQSISITLFCLQINYNKYLGKIITFLGPLSFGVYLVHEHPLVRSYFIGNLFSKDSNNLTVNKIILLISSRGFLIYLISSLIDFLRKKFFELLRIKNLLVFLEKKMFQLLE